MGKAIKEKVVINGPLKLLEATADLDDEKEHCRIPKHQFLGV